jgi:transposase InsO family protein
VGSRDSFQGSCSGCHQGHPGTSRGEFGLKLKEIHTDRGGEFTAAEFVDYCAAEGMHRQHTMPYSPQQNGVVERQNGTMVATVRIDGPRGEG